MNTLKNANESVREVKKTNSWDICERRKFFFLRNFSHILEDEEEQKMEPSQTLCTQNSVFTVQALHQLNVKHTCLTSTTSHMSSQISVTCEAFSKARLFTKETSSKLHGCHCTLIKTPRSGTDVTAPEGHVSLSVSR